MRRMKKQRTNLIYCLLTAVVLLASSTPAHAYLDPTTGSMVISAIVGIFASIALAMKTYWYKIKSFFRGDRKPSASKEEPADTASE
jgi:hypothetical protein